ncbi:peptidase domain-containing ABC transporter [Microbulbifer sediminum]|uniref:peptidase domain-containing ABC transporter n=1 Tax=Microbulbifer sediminum TaxID=2904250 RepID=UPI001F2F4C1B|nr:peptidase domain-containing ABC transporter [Microbulbifer sediminum]
MNASALSREQSPTELLEFSGFRRVPLVLQAEIAECGLACLAMVSSFHGRKMDLTALRQRFTANLKGMNLQQLIQLADSIGLAGRPLKCPLEEIGKLQLPCVLHWDLNHFVVLTGVKKKKVSINDPAAGKRVMSLEEFSRHYTGVALELNPASNFEAQDDRRQMKLSQLWSRLTGLWQVLTSLLVFSLLLQLFALAMPYYMQWVVDEVLVSFDKPLLIVLAIGFGLVVLINVMTTIARSWLVLRVSSLLNMQMGVNLLRHLLRLPLDYFEKRHVGDLVSRFGSLAQIRERLTTGIVETVVDAVMSIAVIVMMLIYSAKLTALVAVFIALYALLRFSLYRPFHRATEEKIQASAKEQTNFLENARAIQTIKLFTSESQRQSIWQNRYAEVINAEIRLGKLRISFDAANKFLFGLEKIVVVYFAALMVMDGNLTIGMVLAFIAYKDQLIERISSFIEQLIEFRMLRLHLDRVSDIALHEQEKNREGSSTLNEVLGELILEDVHFRYSESEPEILSGINLKVRAGESVALTGPSGCGKSTLMKIMLGLLRPTKGRVLLDGQDINAIGLLEYRRQVAAVMQDDTLLSGSVADNITFFDPVPNLIRMQKCAHLAAISQDITRLPMAYDSLVGDMGSQFSGGQNQRLLLARALYQQPSILFLDEATSHLDVRNESIVSTQIERLSMTRVIIAHRPETIKQAETIYRLENGHLCEEEDTESVARHI